MLQPIVSWWHNCMLPKYSLIMSTACTTLNGDAVVRMFDHRVAWK
jgi:hypothetical protein